MISKTYYPGKRETLYDQKVDETLAGVLYFNPVVMNSQTFEDTVASAKKKLVEVVESKSEPFVPTTESGIMDFALKVDAFVFPILLFLYRLVRTASINVGTIIKSFIATLSALFSSKRYQSTKNVLSNTQTVVSYYGVKNAEVVKEFSKNQYSRLKKFSLPLSLNHVFLRSLLSIRPSFINFKFHTPVISLPSAAKMRLSLALAFLFISFASMAILLAPLAISQVSNILMPYAAQNNAVPTPTPIAYNSYYQEEENPLYPIREFRISVPKISLESNIVDNVDPSIEGEYKDKLQFGVAHAKGSYLPPETGGPVYLFAHSTDTIFNIARFNAKFYSVRELESGDEIDLFFNNKKYSYRVRSKEIINPQQIDRVRQTDADLILQTCWPPGTDWQRLVVYADLVSDTTVTAEQVI